jgi:hypothetical protein
MLRSQGVFAKGKVPQRYFAPPKRKIIGELTSGSARKYSALHPGLISFAAPRLGSCRGVSLGITWGFRVIPVAALHAAEKEKYLEAYPGFRAQLQRATPGANVFRRSAAGFLPGHALPVKGTSSGRFR